MQYTLCNTHAFTIQDTMVIAHCIALLAEICYIHTNMLRRSRQRCRQIFLRQNRLLSCQTPTPRIWTLWVMRTLQPPLLLVSSKTLHAMQCTLYTCCALYLNIVHCSHAMLCLYTFGHFSVNYNSVRECGHILEASIVKESYTVLQCAALLCYIAVLHCAALCCIVLHCVALCLIVFHCATLCYSVLYCASQL